MLRDRITKRKREVDVCVEGQVGGHPVLVSVECRDHQRIADVSWVDMMKAKHDRLPTNALILASRSGFTPEALNEASSYGIPTFSLAEIDEADFPKLLGPTSSLWTKSVTVTAERVLIRVLPTSTLAAETVPVVPDNLVYSSDGTELCRVSAVVEMLLKSSQAREYLLSEGKQDHVWFEMELKPELTRVLRTRQLGTDTHQIAVDRGLVIQRLMYPLSVIKQLDVLKYLRSSLIPSLKVTMMDNFVLQ